MDDEPDEGADYPAAGSVPRARGGRQVRGSSAAGRAFTDSGAEALGEAQPVGNVNPDLDLDELDPTGKVRKAAAANRARPPKKSSRKRAAAKWTAISMASVLVAILVFAAYVYQTTIGDMKHTSLLPSGVSQAALPVDPYGNSAMNILLIGSDTRDTAQNCALGGACPNGATAGANGDAELILHVSADRTNATVMSIPRDTYTTVPQCATDSSGNVTITGYVHAQINSALQYGPECQVAADHDLTGITITGYIMFDFAGVVQMSNALGGVPVCVTTAVHDKYSGLNLPAGVSTVQGISALEFLRTRHSFFDGSDLGREEATHYFFSQMINTIRSKLNLSSAATLLAIGQAAASSVTVSNNFSGLSNLQGLVENLNRVPTSAITFVTMPWGIDPNEQSWVIPSQPAANQMFQNIQNDVPYSKNAAPAAGSSAAATKTSAAPAAPPGVVDANVPVAVYNADGVTGRAGQVANTLNLDGFNQAAAIGNWPQNANTTRIYYPSGDAAQAQAVAAALKIPAGQVQQSSQYTSVTVAVGLDFESGSTYAASAGSPAAGGGTGGSPAAGVAVAPPSSSETNATGSGSECIPSAPNGMNPGTLTMAHN